MIDLELIVARLLHYAAVTALAGVSFFPLYALADAEPIALLRWRQGVLLATAIAVLLSGNPVVRFLGRQHERHVG
jgi:putative copper resistance protein D